MPLPLAPGEHLAGTPDQRRALRRALHALRARPDPGQTHPALFLKTLANLLTSPPPFLDPGVLHAGLTETSRRYRELGIAGLLPPDRTFIGTASADPAAFGGFHHPGQGYRHWQMTAVITRYGPLHNPQSPDPRLAALDLIRAYAHDSLHYASSRCYQWHPDGTRLVRVRYGINFRRPDGRPYSVPDPPGSPSTRNLGIIIEAATDREARAITARTARLQAITPPPDDPDRAEYRDATGQLTTADLARHAAAPEPGGPAGFLARMTAYERTIALRYTAFLAELSPASPASLHAAILRAIITGSLTELCRILNQHHGPAAFARLFKTTAYTSSRTQHFGFDTTPYTTPIFLFACCQGRDQRSR